MGIDRRNKYLLAGILLLFFISYKFGIQNTLEERAKYLSQKEQQASSQKINEQMIRLDRQEKILDSKLAGENLMNTSMQHNLLAFLSKQSNKNKVKLLDFKAPHVFEMENDTQITHNFILEGGYTNILKVINALENVGIYGSVIHVDFERERNHRTKKTSLKANLMLQQLGKSI